MSESMTFTLRGRDELSRVLNGAGDSAIRMQRRIDEANRRSARSTNQSATSMSGSVRGMSGAFGAAGNTLSDFSGSAARAGSGMTGMAPALAGAAAGALSLLPAIGGLVPMLVGMGVAGGVVAIASKGVASAWSASAKSGEAYKKAIKGMPASQRELTSTMKDARKEFKGFGDDLLGNVLPGISKGLRAALPAAGLFKGQMMLMGTTLGNLAADAGKALGSSGLRGLLSKNMTMGRQFVDTFGRSLGTFGVSLLKFGAESKSSFNALNQGISGLLTKGLPGFFKGLTPGIDGAAKGFSGLFSMINTLLPAFGRLAGVLGAVVGPALGSFFRFVGKIGSAVMDGLAPVIRALEPVFQGLGMAMNALGGPLSSLIRGFGRLAGGFLSVITGPIKVAVDLFRMAAPYVMALASAVGGALAGAFGSMSGKMGWLQQLKSLVHDNRAVFASAFASMADSVMGFVRAVVGALPGIYGVFHTLASTALTAFGVLINGAAKAFGWVPGIGPKLRSAATGFNAFATTARAGLDKAKGAVNDFSTVAGAKLKTQHLKMNIENWSRALKTAKGQLNDPDLTKEKKAKITAIIKDLESKIKTAKVQVNSVKGKEAILKAKNDTKKGVSSAVLDLLKVKGKTADIKAKNKTGPGKSAAQATIDSLIGVSRDLKGRNKAGAGKSAAQSTINSLIGVTRDLKGRNRASAGKSAAQSTINSLVGKSVDLRARNLAAAGVAAAQNAINSLRGKTVDVLVRMLGKKAGGGLVAGLAGGGPFHMPGYATGGNVKRFPVGGRVRGPGTGVSDDVNAKLSNGEFVMRTAAVNKYGAGFMAAINAGALPTVLASQQPASLTTGAGGSRGATAAPVTNNHTTNVYPHKANFGVADLDTLQRQQETRARIGRPR